ncbi:Clavaminate synthase-like protein [Mycena albidolilacea]|uniref:Clavaminate synthase-like protein n=1 Tax=Mycena albidolilacea TaxID=1033008 RepID=A0AAD7AHH9_9AGAR|nr:Clavaminate synthase-like protein [Mycena albidolilacea]
MAIQLTPLPLPASADASKFTEFGREVSGVDPGNLTSEQFEEVREAFPKYDTLLFWNATLTPEQQYAVTKAFDPTSQNYGHGNNKTEGTAKSILHPDLKTIPRLAEAKLKHPSHTTFHKTTVSPEDAAAGATRFYRWHIDAALYDLSPPRVTTLYALRVPRGPPQTIWALLPPELKSVAVRARVRVMWMGPAHAKSTGLGLEYEGLEVELGALPPWEEAKRKTLPVLWKNPVTGELAFQVHAALYPDGAHLTDLKEVRDLLYTMQRPAIAPHLVYPHDWHENDLVLFHNRGVLHTVVGAFAPEQVRAFHQRDLAASDDPAGPSAEDMGWWA